MFHTFYTYFERLKDGVDTLFLESILFLIVGLLINRFVINFIAEKYFKYDIAKYIECKKT